MEESNEGGTLNIVERPFEGSVPNVIEGSLESSVPNVITRTFRSDANVIAPYNDTMTYSEVAEQENTDPNNAYLVENGIVVQETLTQTNEMRWYGFILEQKSKASIMLQSVSAMDADIYLFQLNQETSGLDLIGGSATSGLGVSEYCSTVLDVGIYYFAISAYEGKGECAFAFYATQDINYEANDTLATAAEVDVNSTIIGIIDNPYDKDYYKFTLTSPVIMGMTTDTGEYNFNFVSVDSSAKIYKISQNEDIYQFDAGSYYITVHSEDGISDVNKNYSIQLNKIANIADNSTSFYYMVNEKAKIVFQSDASGNNMYVNGNPIDVSYSYNVDASNSAGGQRYNITMSNSMSFTRPYSNYTKYYYPYYNGEEPTTW